MLTCNIRELVPTSWPENIWTCDLTQAIAKDIRAGIGILRPLTVWDLDTAPGVSKANILHLAQRLGFNTANGRYAIDLGNHRFAAALLTRTETIKIEIIPENEGSQTIKFNVQEILANWKASSKAQPLLPGVPEFLFAEDSSK